MYSHHLLFVITIDKVLSSNNVLQLVPYVDKTSDQYLNSHVLPNWPSSDEIRNAVLKNMKLEYRDSIQNDNLPKCISNLDLLMKRDVIMSKKVDNGDIFILLYFYSSKIHK